MPECVVIDQKRVPSTMCWRVGATADECGVNRVSARARLRILAERRCRSRYAELVVERSAEQSAIAVERLWSDYEDVRKAARFSAHERTVS